MAVYPVALAVAWNLFETGNDYVAPLPRKRTKAREATKKTADMLSKRRKKLAVREKAKRAEDSDSENDSEDLDLELDLEGVNTSAGRRVWDHYANVLRFCAGLRIFVSRSLTMSDAERAQTFFSQAAQSWASMQCHLTPNFHLAQHTLEWVHFFGVLYAIWVFGYERFMGILSRFNTNGHAGGVLECTLMRGWWKTHLCQELVCSPL